MSYTRGAVSSLATGILVAVEVKFRLLDVFTDVPFAGNQLCVVTDPPPELGADMMQRLAGEIGFSETTFVTAIRPDGYDVRIFTPVSELPFAGHPTLGTAFTLVDEGRVTAHVTQTSAAGDVPVEIDLETRRGTMHQLPTVFGQGFDDREAVARAAGLSMTDLVGDLPIMPISTGIWHLMVPVRDEATLRTAARDDAGCVEVCRRTETESLYLFAVRDQGDVVARMFDRSLEIGEDPATGSAAGPLGAYLAAHRLAGAPGRVIISQGEQIGRPSFLHVEAALSADGFDVRVGGGVRVVGEGTFRIG